MAQEIPGNHFFHFFFSISEFVFGKLQNFATRKKKHYKPLFMIKYCIILSYIYLWRMVACFVL